MSGLANKSASRMRGMLRLRAVGFCGADDSVDPSKLKAISEKFPWVEWGVLFRAELQGTPRYASMDWVQRFGDVVKTTGNEDGTRYMRTAAHLCGDHVEDLLKGDADFASMLHNEYGFNRIQINPTAANGVDSSNLSAGLPGLRACLEAVPGVEFIIQVNEETSDLWKPLGNDPPANMAMLFDESKGLGKLPETWPEPYAHIPCGFAGGLAPSNIERQLRSIADSSAGIPIWCDMESSLRTEVGGQDVFDLEKCNLVIEAAEKLHDAYEVEVISGNFTA